MLLPVFVLLLVFTGRVDPDIKAVELGAQVMTFGTKEACDAKAAEVNKLDALIADTSGHVAGCVPVVIEVDEAKATAAPVPTPESDAELHARVMKDSI